MGRRAGKGTGTVFFHRERKRWMAQFTLGHDPATGRPRKITRSFATKREAEAWRAEMALKHFRGLLTAPEALTLREWAERWLEGKAREVRPRTLALYRQELAYALPSLKDPSLKDPLGGLRLQAVQPAQVRAVLDALLDRGLSSRTVRKVREKLHALFEEALALELVARNPVAPVKVKAPRGGPQERAGRTLQREEAALLLRALDAHPDPRTALALRLCLACGLRKGEVLGLKWEDLDLEAGLLHVRRAWIHDGRAPALSEPKTATGRRIVPIPHATLERLKRYREWWRERQGHPPPPGAWVFPGERLEAPLSLNAMNRALRRITTRLGLPRVRVHDLRHSYGSFLLAQGAPLELVAERMGHANPTITLNIYRHLLKEERRGWVIDPEDLVGPRGEA
ncbi:MAG: tyrosine-type recombinase/integrase [Thermus sp.]|uniref:tyrosine-type recombinase/integrase n=1 Tax=Thermus sp. TaxID=275 RepID=UPI003D0F2839